MENQREIIDLEPRQVYVRKPNNIAVRQERQEPRPELAEAPVKPSADITIFGIKMPWLAWACVAAFCFGFVMVAPVLAVFILLVFGIVKQRGAKRK